MFDSINYKLLALCLGALIIGYVLLAQGPVNNPLSMTVAPIVLVAVYCLLIPVAIMAGKKPENKEKNS